MNSADFRNEYTRLARGFRRDLDVTDERLRALFDVLGHYELAELQAGVDACLRNERFPTFASLHAAIEHASERRRERSNQRDRAGAAGAIDSRTFIPSVQQNDPFAKLCIAIMKARMDRDLMPFECAAMLTAFLDDPGMGADCRGLHAGFVEDGRWDGYPGRTASDFPPYTAWLQTQTQRFREHGEYWNSAEALEAADVAAFDRPVIVHFERFPRTGLSDGYRPVIEPQFPPDPPVEQLGF